MTTYNFILTLTSDAEPSSGLGTELVNDLVPRDHRNQPYIPAAHLKGLMRENLLDLLGALKPFKEAEKIVDAIFGTPGLGGRDGNDGLFSIDNASLKGKAQTAHIARTALNDGGTASDTSLRVTECIPVGTVFKGKIHIQAAPDAWQSLAIRLALLSVMTIGGGRTRGAGACHIETDAGQESPGVLLGKLLPLLKDDIIQPVERQMGEVRTLAPETRFLRLVFEAEAPVCCPETPVVGTNLLKSDFSIPASAVQGALLTRLDASDHDLATSLFEAANFRVWPLLPVTDAAAQVPVRVSQTHKISKLPDKTTGEYEFLDLFLHVKPWHETDSHSPLKGVDGVLLTQADREIELLRSGDLPRVLTSHGVHNDYSAPKNGSEPRNSGNQKGENSSRNLFTVESIAPTTFVGLVALPTDACETLMKVFAENNRVSLGKSRTVRGGGKLTLKEIAPESAIPRQSEAAWKNRTFIVQSPVAIPAELKRDGANIESLLIEIVEAAGWGEVEEASAAAGVRFGWNRHLKGGRQEAVAVILPGSVFKLQQPLSAESLVTRLVAGLGGHRERGYGAVLPHPGEARRLAVSGGRKDTQVVFRSTGNSSRKGYDLWKKAGDDLSASQIASLMTEIVQGKEQASTYLTNQVFQRPKVISDKWLQDGRLLTTNGNNQITGGPLWDVVQGDSDEALKILKVWRDLAVAGKSAGEDN